MGAILIGVRVPPDGVKALDTWAAKQNDSPSRPEVIRRLIEIALKAGQPIGRTPSKIAARAAELAGQAIDRQSDRSAPAQQRATRKQRILKGPAQFRDVRVDHKPKKAGV